MINVGDKVRLTGEDWPSYGLSVGTVVEVESLEHGTLWAEDAGTVGNHNGLYSKSNPEPSGDYSCELVTDTASENFAETAAKFATDPLSTEDIKALTTLGEQLGISSFEQSVHRVTGKIADLLIAKNKQYANSALDPIRVFSKADRTEQLRVRADDKLSRIRNGDASEDAVMDLCGYLILMKIVEESE